MSKNFSIPMSEPKPRLGDDVLAELERHPVGDERVVAVRDVRERPAVDEGGLPLERLHEVRLDRSFSSTVIEPAARSCSAVTGSPSYVCPTVIAPRRARRSCRSRATATIAITSEAAVMSKPVWRT